MARHWSEYAGCAAHLSDKQIKAMDAIARSHEVRDGLDLMARASDRSRSKMSKAGRHDTWEAVDTVFEDYGGS